MDDIKIFVACHEDSYVPKSEILVPIQVGAALTKERFGGMIADDTGDNISNKNRSYCELTAHYWAWKNCSADYYGLFHYRRYLSFNRVHNDTKGIYSLEYSELTQDVIEDIGLHDETIRKLVEQYDIIVPIELEFGGKYKNVWEQYEKSPHLHISDMRTAVEVLGNLYPEYRESANEYMESNRGRFCNMFVMNAHYFNEYSEMLFNVLAKTEEQIDFTNYSIDEYRVIGHIAERILGIYIYHLQKYSHAKIADLRTVKIDYTKKYILRPAFPIRNIAVASSCSNYFTLYFAVLLQSIIENASNDYNYDIILLCNNLSEANQQMLRTAVRGKENISLRIIDIRGLLAGHHFFTSDQKRISIETWFRLFLPEILQEYDKVLYLDSDMVVCSDIADLYDANIDNYLIAATRELSIIGLYNSGVQNVREYIDQELCIINPYDYFSAGVALFNLKRMREQYTLEKLLSLTESRNWVWNDQDVLNVIANGCAMLLDQSWNIMHDRGRTRIIDIRKAPIELFHQYMAAREAPKIVHYAGYEKPWLYPDCDLSEYFWNYARNCCTYEAIMGRLMTKKDQVLENKLLKKPNDSRSVSKQSMGWREKAKLYSQTILPKGTKRREFVKKLYNKLLCPPGWTIRSDLGMHFRILWRKLLNMMHLNKLHCELNYYETLRNRHIGERCFITCTGPSLQIADLERLKNEYTFGVNSIIMAYSKTEWRPTYYAMIDIYNLGGFLSTHPVTGGKFAQREAFFHYRTKLKNRGCDEKYCLINYANHWKGRIKKQKCKLSDNPGVCIYDCFTVTNMAIQLAIHMGFKEIYIIGADCNYDPKKMHFIETEIDNKFRGAKWFPGVVEKSIIGYKSAKKFAEKHGVKIFNATRGGMLEVFERVDFDSIDFK